MCFILNKKFSNAMYSSNENHLVDDEILQQFLYCCDTRPDRHTYIVLSTCG